MTAFSRPSSQTQLAREGDSADPAGPAAQHRLPAGPAREMGEGAFLLRQHEI